MTTEHHIENLRYQDAVARVAGIDLKTTVRVLRAVGIVARCNHDYDLLREIYGALAKSAISDGIPKALHEKPSVSDVESCEKIFKRILKKYGWEKIRSLQRLEECPYQHDMAELKSAGRIYEAYDPR